MARLMPTEADIVADTPTPADIDRLVHEPARLLILTVLTNAEEADFVFLLRTTGLTRGNLSTHLTKLESAEYVSSTRTYDTSPRTTYRLTDAGSGAIADYVATMEATLAGLR